MEDIQKKICHCSLCGNLQKLTENSIQYGTTKFIIIGDSPAKDGWIESKRAFYNTAGKLQGSGRVLEKCGFEIWSKIKNAKIWYEDDQPTDLIWTKLYKEKFIIQ